MELTPAFIRSVSWSLGAPRGWQDGWVVRCRDRDGHFDCASLDGPVLRLGAFVEAVLDVARGRNDVALLADDDTLWLAECHEGVWTRDILPREMRGPHVAIAANDRRVVILGSACVWSRAWDDGDTWEEIALPASVQGVADHVLLLDGDRAVLGFDRGEWGGEALALDFAACNARRVGESGTPVTGLALAGDGRVLVARGQSHMGLLAGRVEIADVDAGTTTTAFEATPTGWPFATAAITQMAGGPDGVVLATWATGLAEPDGPAPPALVAFDGVAGFASVLETWPNARYASSLAAGSTSWCVTMHHAALVVARDTHAVTTFTWDAPPAPVGSRALP